MRHNKDVVRNKTALSFAFNIASVLWCSGNVQCTGQHYRTHFKPQLHRGTRQQATCRIWGMQQAFLKTAPKHQVFFLTQWENSFRNGTDNNWRWWLRTQKCKEGKETTKMVEKENDLSWEWTQRCSFYTTDFKWLFGNCIKMSECEFR
jgi:hypothetical protein